MSLQKLADQMKSRGRDGDTELVHMTKGEVAGLQQLAMAAGGSLTINPDTGLPEASFLKQLLPTILGAGAMLIPGVGLPMAAMIGAGAGAATNKDNPLMGALMGGLGAYGGANLMGGLGATGSAGAAGAKLTTAAPGAVAPASSTVGAFTPPSYSLAPSAVAEPGLRMAAVPMQAGAASLQAPATAMTPAAPAAMTGRQMLTSGLAALAPGMMYQPQQGAPDDREDEGEMARYEYRANPIAGGRPSSSAFTGERRYFEPEFRRVYAAKGGEVKKFADGGEAAAPSSEAVADPAAGMTGMSRDAMLYLYGMAPSSTSANIPVGQTDYVAPEIRFARPAAPVASGGGGGGGGIAYYAPSFGGGFGGEGSIGVNPNQDFGYWSGVSPNIDYSIPVVDRMDFGGSGGMFGGYSPDAPGQEGFDGSPAPGTGPDSIGGLFSEGGGIAALARGGMKAGGFVVPADVVSMVGEGNTDAGYDRIKRMIPGATPIKGKDGGQADTVKTSIEGKQAARIAHGEMYVPPAAVKRAGGAKKLYAMMNKVRQQATGSKKQIKPVNLKKAMA